MKTTIINPTTTHTIEDRRALTKDALKLSRHELQKEFKRRIAQLEADKKKARIALDPSIVRYNIAVAKAAAEVLPSTVDDIGYTAKAINRLQSEDEDDDDADVSGKLEISVHVDRCSMFIGLSTSSKETAAHAKELSNILAGFVPKESGIYRSGESILNWLASDQDSDDYAYDLTIHLAIAIEHDGDAIYLSRSLDATCTSELKDARRQLVTEYRKILEINSAIGRAEADLENLPKMIEELDMSATAMRVKDAGGEAFLGRIMDGVQLILGGQTNLSGLALISGDKDAGSTGSPGSTGEERGSSSD